MTGRAPRDNGEPCAGGPGTGEAARVRRILAERARQLARARDAEDAARRPEELVRFTLAGAPYAVETRFVLEVIAHRTLTPVPGIPEAFRGVVLHRGQFLAAVDIRHLLGVEVRGLSQMARLVILGEGEGAGAEPQLGILADSVEGVMALDPRDIQTTPSGEGIVRGLTADGLTVLDAAQLLADRRLFLNPSDT